MTSTARLRRVLKRELPKISFDDDVIEYLANALEGDFAEDDVVEAWSPFLISHSAASDDESVQEVCRAVLRGLRSDKDGASTSDAAVVEARVGSSGAPGGREAEAKDPAEAQSVGDRIRQRKASADKASSEAVKGLAVWLETLRLTQYAAQAREWCDKMGAADVEEIMENWEDFSDELQLKPLERKRVQKDSASRLATPSASSTAPPPGGSESGRTKQNGAEATAAAVAAAEAAGRQTFGTTENPYIILEEIGSGATATVYRCDRASHPGEEFAVKIISLTKLRLQSDPSRMLEKLHRETAILFSLRHSHIVSLFDVFETKDRLYLVMELVEGGELFEDIVSHGCLTESEARYVFLQLADALRYIHSKGVVHRDLKPENILVDKKESRPGLPEVKISDFGHSKLIDDGYSTALTRVGTPQYWAPEVLDARTNARGYNEKVDLWSLGVVLFVMLEGTYPFDGADNSLEEQVRQAKLTFRPQSSTSTQARDLIRALIQLRPQDRLPLDQCLNHPWVMTMEGPLSQVMKACRETSLGQQGDEERFTLVRDPENVRQLRRDLQIFTTEFKFSAVLRKREVAVTWEKATTSPYSKEAARLEMLKILAFHFPDAAAGGSRGAGYPSATVSVGSPLATVKEEQPALKHRTSGGTFRLLTNVPLKVLEGVGAGVDLQPERGGMRVKKLESNPGQPGILEDDLIVKIDDVSLGSTNFAEVSEVFGQHFRDGALLSIRRKAA